MLTKAAVLFTGKELKPKSIEKIANTLQDLRTKHVLQKDYVVDAVMGGILSMSGMSEEVMNGFPFVDFILGFGRLDDCLAEESGNVRIVLSLGQFLDGFRRPRRSMVLLRRDPKAGSTESRCERHKGDGKSA